MLAPKAILWFYISGSAVKYPKVSQVFSILPQNRVQHFQQFVFMFGFPCVVFSWKRHHCVISEINFSNCWVSVFVYVCMSMYVFVSISRWPSRLCRMSCAHSETWTICSSRRVETDWVLSTLLPSSWQRRTSAACRLNMTGKPRSSFCLEKH